MLFCEENAEAVLCNMNLNRKLHVCCRLRKQEEDEESGMDLGPMDVSLTWAALVQLPKVQSNGDGLLDKDLTSTGPHILQDQRQLPLLQLLLLLLLLLPQLKLQV